MTTLITKIHTDPFDYDRAAKDAFYFWSPCEGKFIFVLTTDGKDNCDFFHIRDTSDPFSHPKMELFTTEELPYEVRVKAGCCHWGRCCQADFDAFEADFIRLCERDNCRWSFRYASDDETHETTIYLLFEKSSTADAVRQSRIDHGIEGGPFPFHPTSGYIRHG